MCNCNDRSTGIAFQIRKQRFQCLFRSRNCLIRQKASSHLWCSLSLLFAVGISSLTNVAHAEWVAYPGFCNTTYTATGSSVNGVALETATKFNSCNTCEHSASVHSVNEETGVYSLSIDEGAGPPGCAPAGVHAYTASCVGDDCVQPAKNNPPICEVGNPCNPGTGTKYEREIDMAVPGARLERSYSSQPKKYSSQMQDLGLGVGWTGTQLSRLDLEYNLATLRRADGYAEVFANTGGSWTTGPDSDYQLQESGTDYVLNHSDGSSQTFDANGLLLSSEEASGQATTYLYDANGQVEQITGPFGHTLSFTYLDSGHLSAVANGAGESATFTYDFGSADHSTYAETVLSGSPVGYWRLNDEFGPYAAAAEAGLRRGVYQGGYQLGQTGPSPTGGAITLNSAAEGSINLQNNTNYASELTLEIWAKPAVTQTDGLPHLFTKNGYYAGSYSDFPVRLSYSTGNGFAFVLSKGDDYFSDLYLSSGPVDTDVWHHVVAVYKAYDRAELWVDGVMVDSATIGYAISSNSRNWQVGSAWGYGGGVNGAAFAGDVAEAALYSSALSSTEIQDHHQAIGFIGNLVRVDYSNGAAKLYHYEYAQYPSHLTGVSYVEADGTTSRYANFTYDVDGYAVLTEHAGGTERYELSYPSENAAEVTDAANATITYNFTSSNGVKLPVTRTNTVDQKTVEYAYDANNNLVCRSDEEGHVTEHQYNAFNQRISTTEGLTGDCSVPTVTPVTRTIAYEYLSSDTDLITRRTADSVLAGAQSETITHYQDPNNPLLPTSVVGTGYMPDGTAIGRITTYSYDSSGRLTSIDGPRNDVTDVTTFTYHNCVSGGHCGQLASVTNAFGHLVTYDLYDGAGRLTQQTDENGLVTTIAYDGRGNLAAVTETATNGEQQVFSFTYNAHNRAVTSTAPGNGSTTHEYNAAGQLIKTTDGLGNYVAYAYGLRGNRTDEDVYDPSGILQRALAASYDVRNNISQINDGIGVTQYTHLATGQLASVVDANQNTRLTRTYDALMQPTQDVDALSGITHYAYDHEGREVSVTAPNGAVTSFMWDDLGGLRQEVSPDSGTTVYAYDDAGNMISCTDARGIQASNTYDALSRLISIAYPDPSLDVTFTYDQGQYGTGRLTRIVDGAGTTDYVYDQRGNRISETRTAGTLTTVTEYTYDTADQLITLTYPSGHKVHYSYDSQGKVTATTLERLDGTTQVLADNIERLPFGPTKQLDYGNGLQLDRTYDQDYRLTAAVIPGVLDTAYVFDAVDNITAWTDAMDASRDQLFGYDALDRLLSAQGPYGDIAFTYDPVGNRLTSAVGLDTQTYLYSPDSNRLDEIRGGLGELFSYDASGNTTASATGDFGYDDTNRLVAYTAPGVVATYAYNGLGERVQKTVNGVATHFRYADSQLIGEYDDAGNEIREYVYLDGQPVAILDAGGGSGPIAPPPAIDFSSRTIQSYNAQQDLSGNAVVLDGGGTLQLTGNLWKRIALPHIISPDTVLTFEFYSATQGEIHGIGFDNDTTLSPTQIFQVYGSQHWGVAVTPYAGSGWQSYSIPVGTYLAGSFSHLIFAMDDDAAAAGESRFRNVRIIEGGAPPASGGDADIYYTHTDHLGAVAKLTDETAQLVWDADRFPFGEIDFQTSSVEMPLRFPGQYYDDESGLFYNYFRDYDPSTGRYIQSDPIGLEGGLNTYAYVGGNPLKFVDPLGLVNVNAWGTGGSSIGGGRGSSPSDKFFGGASLGIGAIGAWGALDDNVVPGPWPDHMPSDDEECPPGEQSKKEKNCLALYNATLQSSCASIKNRRAQQRCQEAAKANYEDCMAQD